MRSALSILALTLFTGAAAAAPSPVEARKIELRLKLREAGERVESADDFTSEAFLRAKLKELQSSYEH